MEEDSPGNNFFLEGKSIRVGDREGSGKEVVLSPMKFFIEKYTMAFDHGPEFLLSAKVPLYSDDDRLKLKVESQYENAMNYYTFINVTFIC